MAGAEVIDDGVVTTVPTCALQIYLTESAKYASSAVTRLRRSEFIEARYAFSFVLANFGIAIAARMPMITTTINSSISVKPLRFMSTPPCRGVRTNVAGGTLPGNAGRTAATRGGSV